MNKEFLKQSLATELLVTEADGKIALSTKQYGLKTANIETFFALDRTGLENGNREHLLLMYTSSARENIYAQYPGKESTDAYAASAKNRVINPNDFRPELYLPGGSLIAKLSFSDIAVSLSDYKELITREQLQVFAAILIRAAFMEGYIYCEKNHPRFLVTFEDGNRKISAEAPLRVGRYFLHLNDGLRQELKTWPTINVPSRNRDGTVAITIEGLLFYLDILAQQEDCKYYYLAQNLCRRHYLAPDKYRQRPIGVGRVNNLLTIVNLIDCLMQEQPIKIILDSLKNGVRPISPIYFERVTGGLVTSHKDCSAISQLNIQID